jgi:group I intron endonuclease
VKQAGVYTILNLVTGRCYVGSSNHIPHRWDCHLSRLNNGKHANRALQTDWDALGADAFAWTVVERCETRDEAIRREQYHIDTTPDLYNAARRAGSGPPDGFKQSAEAKANVSRALKGRVVTWGAKVSESKRGKPMSALARAAHAVAMADPALRARMSVSGTGRQMPKWSEGRRAAQAVKCFTHTEESKAKMSASIRANLAEHPRVGVTPSAETRARMSAAQKGRIITVEARAKISATRKTRGIVMSAESREKWRQTRAGYQHSEETKAKMRDAWERRRLRKASA